MTTLQICEHCGLFVVPSAEGDCPACSQRQCTAENVGTDAPLTPGTQGDAKSAASDRQVAGALRASESVRQGIREFELQRFEAALTSFSHAIELDSKITDAYLWRAHALANLEQVESAVSDFTTVLSLDADRSEALLGRGRLLLARGDFELAIDDLTLYLASPFPEPAAHLDRAAAFRALRREADAVRDENRFADLTGAQVVEN